MEMVLQILMLFILFNCVVKLSFQEGWQAGIFGLLCGGFIILSYPYAVMWSIPQWEAFLNNTTVMLDSAVIITAESAICFAFCIMALRHLYGTKRRRKLLFLFWYPGILIFPVLFYLLTQTINALPDRDPGYIAYGLALVTAAALPVVSRLIRLLFPEREGRLEIHFVASLFVFITGLAFTVSGNITYAAVWQSTEPKAIQLTFLFFFGMFLLGILLGKVKCILRRRVAKGSPHLSTQQQ